MCASEHAVLPPNGDHLSFPKRLPRYALLDGAQFPEVYVYDPGLSNKGLPSY